MPCELHDFPELLARLQYEPLSCNITINGHELPVQSVLTEVRPE